MICAGRKVFTETKAGPRIIFEGLPETKRIDGFYLLPEGVRLPVAMVKEVYVPGGYILAPGCSVEENTVLNGENQECVMIKGSDTRRNIIMEALIPHHLISKIIEPSREAHPHQWQ
jgi:hypothetical protein